MTLKIRTIVNVLIKYENQKEAPSMNYRGLIWAGVYVQDLEASISFYRDVLSLPLLDHGEDWAHFD